MKAAKRRVSNICQNEVICRLPECNYALRVFQGKNITCFDGLVKSGYYLLLYHFHIVVCSRNCQSSLGSLKLTARVKFSKDLKYFMKNFYRLFTVAA